MHPWMDEWLSSNIRMRGVSVRELNSNRLLVSIHIPKTGGQSFQYILQSLAPNGMFLDYGDRPLSDGLTERRMNLARQDLTRLMTLHDRLKQGSEWSVVHGHFLSGKYRSYFPEARFLCWIRDPVERVCSHYAYWRRNSRELRNVAEEEKPGILAFAHRPSSRNVQARFLNGANPSSFAFIGRTEEYDRSLKLLGNTLGISPPAAEVRNQNQDKQTTRYSIEASTRAAIEHLNQQDMELVPLFQERFAVLCEQYGI